jgi:predicted nucleic acid-binding protein
MNVVDSSLWLEYFAGNIRGTPVSDVIKNLKSVYVPAIIIYEVFKKLLLEKNENGALVAIAHMRQGTVVNLDVELALSAAKFSKEYKLPMADSIIYATTIKNHAVLWTQDSHFNGLESVNYFEKVN